MGQASVAATPASDIVTGLASVGVSVPQSQVQSFLTTLDEDVLGSDLLPLYVLSQFDTSGPVTQSPRLVTSATVDEMVVANMSVVKSSLTKALDSTGAGTAAAVDAYVTVKQALSVVASPEFAQAHYARNAEMYVNPPQTVESLTGGSFGNPSDWQRVTGTQAASRNLGSDEGNVSYVYVGNDERYKGYQYVFDSDGNLVRDPANMGTHNVSDPNSEGSNHVWSDVLPWILLGNSTNDPSTPEQRLNSAIASSPQLASEIGVDRLKLIVFTFQQLKNKTANVAPKGQMGV
jgi:hypothetical protein